MGRLIEPPLLQITSTDTKRFKFIKQAITLKTIFVREHVFGYKLCSYKPNSRPYFEGFCLNQFFFEELWLSEHFIHFKLHAFLLMVSFPLMLQTKECGHL